MYSNRMIFRCKGSKQCGKRENAGFLQMFSEGFFSRVFKSWHFTVKDSGIQNCLSCTVYRKLHAYDISHCILYIAYFCTHRSYN